MVITNNSLNKIQKNRFTKKSKFFFLKFGDLRLACKNDGRLELIQITMIKKKIKFFIKKKKSEIDITREKIWYFGRPNYLIQKKSKNSRMSKGKGLVERKVIKVRKNFIMFEFKGVNKNLLISLSKLINKFLNVKFYVISYNCIFLPLWSKNNKYIIYLNKYLAG